MNHSERHQRLMNHHLAVVNHILSWAGDAQGRLLDIGAHNGCGLPRGGSITAPLLQRQWLGVLFEPTPRTFASLQQEMIDAAWSKHTQLVNSAVVPNSHRDSSITLYDFHNMTAVENSYFASADRTWIESSLDVCPAGWDGRIHQLSVPAITCDQLIDTYGGNWDLVKIDAEGLTISILQSMPWHLMQVRMICCEAECNLDDLTAQLREQGFANRIDISHDVFFTK
jgi:FkbM family methyltransferase